MSQNMSEMMKAWKKSCEKEDAGWTDKSRFYDLRKRPTGRRIHSEGGMTPEGEALRAKELGLDEEIADPMEDEA